MLKLRNTYHPGFYILPRNEADGLHLFQLLSREEEIAVSWKDKHTDLFDSKKTRKLIQVQLRSLQYYQPLLKKLENDYRVKQLFNTDLLHVQQYLFTTLKIEPTSKVEVEYDGSRLLQAVKVDDENDVHPPLFSLLYFDLHTYSGILASEDIKLTAHSGVYVPPRQSSDYYRLETQVAACDHLPSGNLCPLRQNQCPQ